MNNDESHNIWIQQISDQGEREGRYRFYIFFATIFLLVTILTIIHWLQIKFPPPFLYGQFSIIGLSAYITREIKISTNKSMAILSDINNIAAKLPFSSSLLDYLNNKKSDIKKKDFSHIKLLPVEILISGIYVYLVIFTDQLKTYQGEYFEYFIVLLTLLFLIQYIKIRSYSGLYGISAEVEALYQRIKFIEQAIEKANKR